LSKANSGGNQTAKDAVVQFLNQNSGERYTVAEIADAVGYSRNHIRSVSKSLTENGTINGEKNQSRRVPAYIINGDYLVIVSRSALLDIVENYRPDQLSRLQNASIDTIRRFVRNNIADGTAAGDAMWEFWV